MLALAILLAGITEGLTIGTVIIMILLAAVVLAIALVGFRLANRPVEHNGPTFNIIRERKERVRSAPAPAPNVTKNYSHHYHIGNEVREFQFEYCTLCGKRLTDK